jgi:hypothetical protein
MQEWKIQKNTGECARCKAKFAVGQRLFSVLFEKPEGLLREDYCTACFSEARPAGFFSFWRTSIPEPDAPKRPAIDMEAIFDVFRNMREPGEPSAARLRFILALMLMRKKRLRLNRITRRGNREYLILVEPKVGAEHEVESMNLTPEEMAELRDKLSAWMGFPGESQAGSAGPSGASAEGQPAKGDGSGASGVGSQAAPQTTTENAGGGPAGAGGEVVPEAIPASGKETAGGQAGEESERQAGGK